MIDEGVYTYIEPRSDLYGYWRRHLPLPEYEIWRRDIEPSG